MGKTTVKLFLLGICLVFILTSCEDQSKSIDDSFYGYQYFPLQVGNYWVYQHDSIVVSMFGSELSSSRSYVREEITDVFINASGDSIFRLERSISQNSDGPFSVRDVWTAERDSEGAYRTEENLRFNKLQFPIELDAEWRGNLFDNLTEVEIGGELIWVYKDWGDYLLEKRNLSKTINGRAFTDVISILQADHDFGIERRFSKEYYAPGIGLIEKKMEIFDTQCTCPGQEWLEKAQAGFVLHQKLIESN